MLPQPGMDFFNQLSLNMFIVQEQILSCLWDPIRADNDCVTKAPAPGARQWTTSPGQHSESFDLHCLVLLGAFCRSITMMSLVRENKV